MTSKLPYCVSLCAKTRLERPCARSCRCTNARYRRTCCSNSGRLSVERTANVRDGDDSGGMCSASLAPAAGEVGVPGPEGLDALDGVDKRRSKPGSCASSSSSRRTFLASRVQRVMFSHTHSLVSRARPWLPPRELVPRLRARFLSSARDSDGVRTGSISGDETSERGVPALYDPELSVETDASDEVEYDDECDRIELDDEVVPKEKTDELDEVE